MKYLVYFKTLEDNHRCLYNDDNFETLDYLPDTKDCHHFEVFKGYDATDDGLIKFKSDMIKWDEELKNNEIMPIDYFKYYTHYSAVLMTFKRLCKGKYEDHEPIDATESKWIEATHNGGLTYCNSGIHNSYGYDFSAFYPSLMGQYKFILPHKKGTEQYLKEIPNKTSLGFYRVKITSDHKHATKLFAFSTDDVYNNISLAHALELQDDYKFKIELIVDDKPNAYIYPTGIRSSNIFGVWVDKLSKIKMKHPKNKLIKHLLSSLWGTLSQSNNIIKTWDEIQEEGLKIGMGSSFDYKIIDYRAGKDYYKLQCMAEPYRHNIRLKSFLTAYGRVNISEVAQTNIEGTIRIHTDGIVFNKPMKDKFIGLIKEDKTTGRINWKGVNCYTCLSSCSV
jgi:hypothetical protein